MSAIADDLCAEVRHQCEQAERFKRLWMQANEELERAKSVIELSGALLDRVLVPRALLDAANKFVQRVEAGEIQSQRTYLEFRDALALLDKEKQPLCS